MKYSCYFVTKLRLSIIQHISSVFFAAHEIAEYIQSGERIIVVLLLLFLNFLTGKIRSILINHSRFVKITWAQPQKTFALQSISDVWCREKPAAASSRENTLKKMSGRYVY